MKHPDIEWYKNISLRKRIPTYCPIGTCDKCPRYYLSLKLTNNIFPGALNIPEDVRKKIEMKWIGSDAFSSDDDTASITESSAGGLLAFSGFCPEVAQKYMGLYCSSSHGFVDDEHKYSVHKLLNEEDVDKSDPRFMWAHIGERHYSDCKEYSVYFSSTSKPVPTKKRNKGLSTRLRWQVLERDNFICQYCGVRGGEKSPLHVDHKVSIADGGTDDLDNLITSCQKCNLGKGAKSVTL